MLDNKMISKLTKRYSIQTLFAVAVMSLVVILIKTFAHVDTLVYPLVVSVVFTLVIEFADVIIWKFLAKNSVDTLPTFFSAVSGFRMLLAIATLIGCYIACLLYCSWSRCYAGILPCVLGFLSLGYCTSLCIFLACVE